MVGTLRKLVWVFEFETRCQFQMSDVKSVERLEFQNVLTRILRREGWEINDLSPLSWQFFEISWSLSCFQRLRVLKRILVSRKLKYHNMISWNVRLFESCLSQKTRYYRNLIVFSCLQFADCYIWPRICLVVWFLCFNHYYGIFWKVSLKKSWCCRKHVFVFEIVSLKDLNKFLIKLSFSLDCWVKDFTPLWKGFENFSILGVNLFLES